MVTLLVNLDTEVEMGITDAPLGRVTDDVMVGSSEGVVMTDTVGIVDSLATYCWLKSVPLAGREDVLEGVMLSEMVVEGDIGCGGDIEEVDLRLDVCTEIRDSVDGAKEELEVNGDSS